MKEKLESWRLEQAYMKVGLNASFCILPENLWKLPSHLQGIHHWNVAWHIPNPSNTDFWGSSLASSFLAENDPPSSPYIREMLLSYAGSILHFWLSPLNKAYFVQCPSLTDWGGGQHKHRQLKNIKTISELKTQYSAINSPSVWKSIKADILSFTYLSLKQGFLVSLRGKRTSCENPRNLEWHTRWAPLPALPCGALRTLNKPHSPDFTNVWHIQSVLPTLT